MIKWFLLGVGCHGPEGWGSIRPRVVPAWIWGGPKLGVGTNPVVGGPCLCFGTKQRVCGREYRVAVEDGQQRGCMAPGASPACWDEVGDRTPLCTVWRGKGEEDAPRDAAARGGMDVPPGHHTCGQTGVPGKVWSSACTRYVIAGVPSLATPHPSPHSPWDAGDRAGGMPPLQCDSARPQPQPHRRPPGQGSTQGWRN